METLEQKKRRLFGRKYLPEYLEELGRLLQREVYPFELLSIVETDYFIHTVCHIEGKKIKYREIINFSDKEKLLKILHETIHVWNMPYLVYTSYSQDCGLIKIDSLSDFNWEFQFNDEHAGIIELMRGDGCEEILLDYYEEHLEFYLEIEIKSSLENQ